MLGTVYSPDSVTSTVEKPVPTTMGIASIASVAVIDIGLLVYFKKRKR
jgi:hypothetical protein